MTPVPDPVSLGEIVRRLEAIETRLDRLLDDHEIRLRHLEKWQYAIPPTLIVAVASVAAGVLR